MSWKMSEAVAALRRDRALRPLLDRIGPIKIPSHRPYFWALGSAILAQQVSGASARAVNSRVRALYPDQRYPDPESILATSDKNLLAAGVSRQKRRYLYALAEAFGDGGLGNVRFSRLSDDEIMERLTAIVGIGRWTAEMFLMFSMHRRDVFPIDDLGIRKAMERQFDISEPEAMVERAERWRPYRTAASVYLWRSLAVEPA
jgi:DNA-3-methyladenine glycosylase II